MKEDRLFLIFTLVKHMGECFRKGLKGVVQMCRCVVLQFRSVLELLSF